MVNNVYINRSIFIQFVLDISMGFERIGNSSEMHFAGHLSNPEFSLTVQSKNA